LKKTYLMTPGPTQVAAETMLAMAHPIFHHRTPAFEAMLKEATELLRYVMQTSGDVFVLAGSGSAALEACVSSALRPGDRAICVRGGKFGERWADICTAFGVTPVNMDIEWGTAVRPEAVAELLAKDPGIRAVCVQLCETSTATLTDVEALGRITRDTETLLIVDGVSSVGAVEYRMDAWGVDLTAIGSQKALMLPPGLAVVAASPKAMQAVQTGKPTAFYLSLQAAKKAADKGTTPYTPAVTLIAGLLATLRELQAEGIENVWARHALLGKALRAGAAALGLGLFSQSPADCVTALTLPDGVDGGALLKNAERKFGVKFAGGQEQLKGKIVRVSTMGYVGLFDVVISLSALEMALADAGVPVELGAGIRAAEEVFLAG
jgi:aspartate aminotransferase-like enzyme